MIGAAALIGFILTIPAANWLIVTYGAVPVGFGLVAPSGVFMAGLALVLRDIVQERFGGHSAIAAIFAGAALSAFLAPPALVLASAGAFLLSELADLIVYTPLRKRGFLVAVVASSVVGLAIDSALFLWLAFGSFEYLAGQIVGKVEMVALAALVLWAARRSERDA
jgi:uncharacterized PurR-regulated membrane protein YhhQ (DUF165 family)